MEKRNFEISIKINEVTDYFVLGIEKKTKIVTENKEEAIRLFNQQWNILAKFSAPSYDGEVVLTLDQNSSDRIFPSWTNLKTVRFCLTGRLLCMLKQNGIVNVE